MANQPPLDYQPKLLANELTECGQSSHPPKICLHIWSLIHYNGNQILPNKAHLQPIPPPPLALAIICGPCKPICGDPHGSDISKHGHLQCTYGPYTLP